MEPADIGRLREVECPRVSPDGRLVAFVVEDVDVEANEYRASVWLGTTDGGVDAAPFAAGRADSHPAWSPDGRNLALVSHEEPGWWDLEVVPVLGGGERRRVCRWPEAITDLAWSPDGTRIAFLARDRDQQRYGKPGENKPAKDMPPRRVTKLFSRRNGAGWIYDRPMRIFIVPMDGASRPMSVTAGDYQAAGLTWSPDGTKLAFASARHDTWDLDLAVDLWAVAADGTGEPGCLTETFASYSAPSWSPDGTRLAYLHYATPADNPRNTQVGVLDLASGTRKLLTATLDRTCVTGTRPPLWVGDDLLFAVEDAGNVHLYRVNSAGKSGPEPVVSGPRCISDWDWSADSLAFVATTPTSLPELFLAGLKVRTPSAEDAQPAAAPPERRVTDLSRGSLSGLTVVDPEPFTARSSDGTTVDCWAMPPAAAEPTLRYPTLLNVHGGPFTQYGNFFHDDFQLQAAAGFGVLYCNPRGSSGHGEEWGRAIRWPECKTDPGSGWGGVDYDDIMACLDEACRRFTWIDPERLGILGGSYGGFMTAWAIGHTKRFRAACPERADINLLTGEHNSDVATAFRGYVGRNHLEDPAAYLRQSPITYIDYMTTPVLIVHSEDDLRVPINQSEELFVGLRTLGRDPIFIRFPGENHGLASSGSPRHRVQRAALILDWFTEKLGTQPSTSTQTVQAAMQTSPTPPVSRVNTERQEMTP